jgi:replicative DNA helicase
LATGGEPADANLVDAKTSALNTVQELEAESLHGRPKGFYTGLRCVDYRLGGLKPGKLIIIGARPSMGKTALLRNIMEGAAERNSGVQFPLFCAEMSRREMDERQLSSLTHRDHISDAVTYQGMSGEKLTPFEMMRIKDIAHKVPSNLILCDTPSLSLDYIERRIWALKRKGPVGAVGIDYLQIMRRPDAKGRNQADVLAEMTGGMKRLARSSGCALIVLSQLGRQVEGRDDKRPQMADLRESGSIEQDADIVLLVYREFYYLERAEPRIGTPEHVKWQEDCEILRRKLDVICAKNRGGGVGTDHQDYYAEFDRIIDVRGAA